MAAKKSAFEKACETATPSLADAYAPGLRALGADSPHVGCKDTRRFTGSIALDEALQQVKGYGQAARWDYGVGYRPSSSAETAVWVEVHPAQTTNVSEVLRKLDWLKGFLRENAKDLWELTKRVPEDTGAFHWVATNSGTHIRPGSREERRLRQAGLNLPKRKLELP